MQHRTRFLPPLALLGLLLALSGCREGSARYQGSIEVVTDPANAEILCDGQSAGSLISNLAPGKHLIVARRPGYREARKTVELVGNSASVTLQLERITGFVLIHSEPPGASVQLGKIKSGTTPMLVPECPPGTYAVTFSKPGFKSSSTQITVDGRAPKKVTGRLMSNAGTLNITSFPAGATCVMEGSNRGVTPVTIENLEAGRYEVKLELAGYHPFSDRVTVTASAESEVNANLIPLDGSIRVVTRPIKCRVYLDGNLRGLSVADIRPVKPGTHTIKVEKEGYESASRTVLVGNDSHVTEEFNLVKNAGRLVLTTVPAGVTVLIDGEKKGTTRPKPFDTNNASEVFEVELLAKGTHTLQLVREKHEAIREEFEISGDAAVTIQRELKRLFVLDWVIRVRGRDEGWKGSKVETHRNGDVTMEIDRGILRRFKAGEIIEQGPLQKQ